MTADTATAVRKCGASFKRKVKGGAEKTLRCEKPHGHDGAHGTVRVVKEIKVPLAALNSLETVPDTEYVPLVARERSDEQRVVDSHVKEAYEAWVGAGKPDKPQDSPRKRYLVPPEHEEGIRTMLRRAGEFHSKRVQIAPAVKHESGNVSIQFRVTDRKKDERPSEMRQTNAGS